MKCPTCDGSGEIDARTASFGATVAAKRKEMHLTQDELSRRCGLSRTTIANIEMGRQSVKLSHVRPLATALEMPPEDLLP